MAICQILGSATGIPLNNSAVSTIDKVRVAAVFNHETRQLDLEWCPVLGAAQYHIYESATGWPDPAVDPVVASTSELFHSLPVPDGDPRRFYRVTAELASRGSCR